jgi:hypothetical protein
MSFFADKVGVGNHTCALQRNMNKHHITALDSQHVARYPRIIER